MKRRGALYPCIERKVSISPGFGHQGTWVSRLEEERLCCSSSQANREGLCWRKHNGSRMTLTFMGQLTSVHNPPMSAPVAFLVDVLVCI